MIWFDEKMRLLIMYTYLTNWLINYIPQLISNFSLSFLNRHGDEIAIPLLVAEEKDALIKSLTAKATEIAGLKASLVSDLSNLVGNLNGWKNEKEKEILKKNQKQNLGCE